MVVLLADLNNVFPCRSTTVDDGTHNVSRWMTWLPISLKNAAKCDKWYQLQNLSITESLNANGLWKKGSPLELQRCHLQCRTKTKQPKIYSRVWPCLAWVRTSNRSPRASPVASYALAFVSTIWSETTLLLRGAFFRVSWLTLLL